MDLCEEAKKINMEICEGSLTREQEKRLAARVGKIHYKGYASAYHPWRVEEFERAEDDGE